MSNQAGQRKPYFWRLFVSIFSIALVLSLLLGYVLFHQYKKSVISVAHQSSQLVLEQVKYHAEMTDERVRQYGATLAANPQAIALYTSETLTAHQMLTSLSSINLNLKNFPPIHSVYLYNGYTDTIYMAGAETTFAPSDLFFDREMVSLIRQKTSRGFSPPYYRMVPFSHINTREVPIYSYIISDQYSPSSSLHYALVVNIKIDYLFESIDFQSLSSSEAVLKKNNFLVFDKSQLMGITDATIFEQATVPPALLEELSSQQGYTGSITTSIQGEDFIVDYTTMEHTNWIIASIVAESYFQSFSSLLLQTTLSLVLVAVALALLLAYFVSYQLYQPVGRTLKVLEEIGPSYQEAGLEQVSKSEFSTIQKRLREISQDMSLLIGAHHRSQAAALRETVWRQITMQKYSTDSFIDKCNEYGLAMEHGQRVFLAAVTIDEYQAFSSQLSAQDLTLTRYAIEAILMEVLSIRLPNEAFFISHNEALCLLVADEAAEEEIVELLSMAQELIAQVLEVNISCFLSHERYGIETLEEQYQETGFLVKHKFLYQPQIILAMQDIEELPNYNTNEINAEHIRQLIQQGNQEELEQFLDDIFSSLAGHNFDTIMAALTFLVTAIFNTLWQLEKNSPLTFSVSYSKVIEELLSAEYLNEGKSLLVALSAEITKEIASVHTHSQQSVCEAVREHILQNLKDPNLSVSEIAPLFYLTPASLNRSFRAMYQQSVQEFITETRLAKATDLLINTDHTIKEITEAIGWSNTKYFYTQFKNLHGVTPTQYRTHSAMLALSREEADLKE